MKPTFEFTDYSLEYLSHGDDQVAAWARELLQYRRIIDAIFTVNMMYPFKMS